MPDVPRLTRTGTSSVRRRKGWLTRNLGPVAPTVQEIIPADHIVANDAEWDALFGQSTATIDGAVIDVSGSNFTQRTISNHEFVQGITLRSADASSSIPSLLLVHPVNNVTCNSLNLQMTGWPADYPQIVRWSTSGTYSGIRFVNCLFRHGYGASLTDFDMTADLAEYSDGVGLASKLADAFGVPASVVNHDFELINNTFSDLSNAIKSCGNLSGDVWYDRNYMRRIYQDNIAFGTDISAELLNSLYITRNIGHVSFAYASDDGNPHADWTQALGGLYDILVSAGNRFYYDEVRSTAWGMQGHWWSGGVDLLDGQNVIKRAFSISDLLVGDNNNQFIIGSDGRADFLTALVYGLTIAPLNEGFTDARNMSINGQDDGQYYVGYSHLYRINQDNSSSSSRTISDNNAFLDIGTAEISVFPNWADRLTATSVAALNAALTPISPYASMGHVFSQNAINWTTEERTEVINWDLVPAGVGSASVWDVAPSTLTTVQLGKVLNLATSIPVVPLSGTEWRTLASDGVTVVQDWTSTSGTTAHGELLEARITSSASAHGSVSAELLINGFTTSVSITTFAQHWDNQGTVWFDDSVDIGAGVTEMTFSGRIRSSADVSGDFGIFGAEGTRLALVGESTGDNCWIKIEDSADAVVLETDDFSIPAVAAGGDWVDLVWYIDWANATTSLWVNGVLNGTWAFTTAGTGTAITNRRIQFLYRNSSTIFDGEVQYLRVWKNEAPDANGNEPIAVPYKEILGDAAVVNLDPWIQGGTVLDVPL